MFITIIILDKMTIGFFSAFLNIAKGENMIDKGKPMIIIYNKTFVKAPKNSLSNVVQDSKTIKFNVKNT